MQSQAEKANNAAAHDPRTTLGPAHSANMLRPYSLAALVALGFASELCIPLSVHGQIPAVAVPSVSTAGAAAANSAAPSPATAAEASRTPSQPLTAQPFAAQPPSARAQPLAAAPAPPVVGAPVAPLREAKSQITYMRDDKGQLKAVVNFGFKEFEQFLAQQQGGAEQQKPVYRLDNVELTGTSDDRYVRLDAKFVVYIDAPNWVRVPLDLRGVVLDNPVAYRGPGKYAVEFNAETKDYALWLEGAGDKPHELNIKLIVPLERIGGQDGLRIFLPRSWNATVNLSVPGEGLLAQVSAGAALKEVLAEGKRTRFKAGGTGGEFQLTWGRAETAAKRATVLLEANTDVLAVIDGRSVAYETQWTVNSFGGEFDRFEIRLPPSSVLVDEGLADVEIVRLTSGGKGGPGDTYEVRRTLGFTKSMTLRLRALRPLVGGGQTFFDFGGFEVLKAVRQWGYLGVVIEGEWQALWGQRDQVRQVDQMPETFRGRNVAAVFEYFGRPYSLFGRIVPRETRVTIDPTYQVDATAKRIFLEATLPYRVGGAKVFSLDVDFPGWRIDDVGPAEIVDVAALALGQSEPLTIPLLQPSTGDFRITVRGHMDVPPEAKTVSFSVPHPRADVVGEATIVVRAAENVELSPRDAAHGGLIRHTAAARPAARGKSWTYTTDAAAARFESDFRVLARSVTVHSTAGVRLKPDGGDVSQKFSFVVAREPIDGFDFEVPSELIETPGRLEMTIDGKPAQWVVVDEAPEGANHGSRIRVELPTAKLGPVEVAAAFALAKETPVADASAAVRVPLVVPADGSQNANEVRIEAAEGVAVQHVDEPWVVDPQKTQTWRSTVGRSEIVVGVRWETPEPVDDTIVERMWMQSVAGIHARQERAVFRLTTGLPSLRVLLPPGSSGASVLVNGVRVEPDAERGPAALEFPLRLPKSDSRTFVVDVRYRAAGGEDSVVVAPRLDRSPPVRHAFYQLTYAGDLCLWRYSAGFLPEFEWSWYGLALARRPLLSQSQLEDWVGATHESPIAERANVYLFSTFGEQTPLEVRLVKRTTLVLTASGCVLVFCWALLYLPALRRPLVLIPIAVGLAGVGLAYPDVAPLTAQAAALGAALGFTAALLERNVNRRRRRTVRAAEEVSASQRGSTRTRAGAPLASPMSTATVDMPAVYSETGGATT
jgi:hypothetical protein